MLPSEPEHLSRPEEAAESDYDHIAELFPAPLQQLPCKG